jgi:hypothetical protein
MFMRGEAQKIRIFHADQAYCKDIKFGKFCVKLISNGGGEEDKSHTQNVKAKIFW